VSADHAGTISDSGPVHKTRLRPCRPIGGHLVEAKDTPRPLPALQEGSTIDGLWGAIVPAKPASTRHGIERDRQRHKRGVLRGRCVIEITVTRSLKTRLVDRDAFPVFRFLILKILKFQPWIGPLPIKQSDGGEVLGINAGVPAVLLADDVRCK
jgi:hypothetical protein